MVKVGDSSVAVGFGNDIKFITVGHERFGDSADALGNGTVPGPTRRSRKSQVRARARS
jgi:hypothetical protein